MPRAGLEHFFEKKNTSQECTSEQNLFCKKFQIHQGEPTFITRIRFPRNINYQLICESLIAENV